VLKGASRLETLFLTIKVIGGIVLGAFLLYGVGRLLGLGFAESLKNVFKR